MTGKKKPQEIKKMAVVKEKIEYNPEGNYEWSGNALIPILGVHFQEIYNGLKLLWQATEPANNISEAKQHVALFSALQSVEKSFIASVESGLIKEKK